MVFFDLLLHNSNSRLTQIFFFYWFLRSGVKISPTLETDRNGRLYISVRLDRLKLKFKSFDSATCLTRHAAYLPCV